MKAHALVAALVLTFSGAGQRVIASSNSGFLRVSVVDEEGKNVPDAPIYIEGSHPGRFFGRENEAATKFMLSAGDYTVSSAIVRHIPGGFIDRLVSHKAIVHIEAEGEVNVVLTLETIPDHVPDLVYSNLRRSGFQSPVTR